MTKEAFGGPLIALALHQDVNDILFLINCTPRVLPLLLNGDKDFVDVPRVAQTSLPLFELARVFGTKLLAQLSHRLIGDCDATFGKQLFDLTEAEAERVIQPDRMADDVRCKTIAVVAG